MFLSVFDIFKIGIGPSSSHTTGPMTGAVRFLDALRELVNTLVVDPNLATLEPARIEVTLHGSLAFTGKGHATDRAVILGLTGLLPDTLDPDDAERPENEVRQNRRISPSGMGEPDFDPATDLVFSSCWRSAAKTWCSRMRRLTG